MSYTHTRKSGYVWRNTLRSARRSSAGRRYVGITVVSTLKGLHRDLEQGAIRGEEVLREHREYLQEHEQRMERLSQRP